MRQTVLGRTGFCRTRRICLVELRRIPLTTGHREHRSSRPPAFTTTQLCVQEHHSSSEYSNQCIETVARIIRTWDGPVLTKARNHFLCLQSCSIDPGQRIVREENLQTRNGDEIVVAVELFDLVVYCSLAATGYPLGTGERSDHGAERKGSGGISQQQCGGAGAKNMSRVLSRRNRAGKGGPRRPRMN